MTTKPYVAAGLAMLALSNVALAQSTTGSGTLGIGGNPATGVDSNTSVGTRTPGPVTVDPRRNPSGSRINDAGPLGTTGGIDTTVGGTTDSITGSGLPAGTANTPGMGRGAIGSGTGGIGSSVTGPAGTSGVGIGAGAGGIGVGAGASGVGAGAGASGAGR